MNFYFNIDENMCADEDWVVNYLCTLFPEVSAESHRKSLHNSGIGCRGWYPCAVCRTVWEALDKSGIYHSNSAGWGE